MERRQNRTQPAIIDSSQFGVSFSLKQCRNFTIPPKNTLSWLIDELGFRRFRLMSYWDEHEPIRGSYNFTELDWQIDRVAQAGGVITLCLGVRQPRWPENHWPSWARILPEHERTQALRNFIAAVVTRYKDYAAIISWQLENEALNRGFGTHGDFNRTRLRNEFELVMSLDPHRKIIMSTSNTYGIPLRQPRPDQFGFTLYQIQFENGNYSHNRLPIWWWNLRAQLIRCLTGRTSFIHELQVEPWGPRAIWEMTNQEQAISMNPARIESNIKCAKKTGLYPIDLWGGEWWYWRAQHHDYAIKDAVLNSLTSDL